MAAVHATCGKPFEAGLTCCWPRPPATSTRRPTRPSGRCSSDGFPRGGAVAAVSPAASAACEAALSARPGLSREATPADLARRRFLAAGVIHTPAIAVLIGAFGLGGLRIEELPHPVAFTHWLPRRPVDWHPSTW